MPRPTPRLLAAVSLLALAAGPVGAQTLASDLWSEWQASSAAMGAQLSADVSQQGNALILENFTSRSEDEQIITTATLDRITLTEEGDGTVTVTLSNPYTTTFDFPNDSGDRITVDIVMTHESLDMTVSGPVGERTYAYSADTIRIVDGPIVNTSGGEVPTVDMEIVARDLDATYSVIGDTPDTQSFESTSNTGSLAARIDILPPPDEEGRFKGSFGLGEMTSSGSGNMAAIAAMQQMPEAGMPDGFDVSADLTYAWARFEIDFESPSDAFDLSYVNEGGTMTFALSKDAFDYGVTAQGIATSIAGTEMPVPVQASAAASELAFSVPLAASPTPSDASLRFGYTDLMASDGLWSLIDPAGQVPRSPVTLLLDATAQVQIMVDLMSEQAMMADTPPAELRALNVAALELSFGDTSLTGNADMTFAPGQMPPQPVGQANLSLSGGNALLDQLQAAGVIDAQQAGMARGVAGMFARPGATPDTIETTIDFLPGGSITANGVPLQ